MLRVEERVQERVCMTGRRANMLVQVSLRSLSREHVSSRLHAAREGNTNAEGIVQYLYIETTSDSRAQMEPHHPLVLPPHDGLVVNEPLLQEPIFSNL